MGAHYLGDFSEDAFQHRRFNPITGEVYDFERPRVIRKVKQFRRKTFLRLLPTSILCAFIIFAVTGFTARGLSLETGRALLASPHLLTLILYSLITAQLLVSLSYCGFMAWHEKRVRRAKFKGHFVMFREDVVEATLNQISAEQLEDCIDDGLSDHFPRENTPNKGGRPSTKRKRMAKAYNSLFQNGHGDTSQLVVLQKVNQLAGTNGSVYTLKRAIEEVEAARERSKTIEK
ncbi:hypothetical protein [Phaeobacter inhibens]|uniref:Uncharacterized protein n=1 Tax=Phaeobacter inhibens TaxID=221822 RepID=A0A2I7K5R1_9RHOB|nr:hypothetical protein [Phaeobacter inhibens]AUQ97915.1 hypothetical protein PhaeoP88_00518 [Phaeobacter inhibens]